MKKWNLVFLLTVSILCMQVCQAQETPPASSGTNSETQAAVEVEDTNDAEDIKADMAEAQQDIAEAQEDVREAMVEAQQGWQEGMKEARKGLLEAQKQLKQSGINIALPRIAGTSMNMFASADAAEKTESVLLIPDKPIDPKILGQLTEDIQVMALIIEEKAASNKTASGGGYGGGMSSGWMSLNIFGCGSSGIKSVYLGGYGIIFTLDVDFPLILIKGAEQKPLEAEQEKKDEVWLRSKDKLKGKDKTADETKDEESGLVFDPDKVSQLQKDLTAALKHASNIRNMEPREKIVIVVRSVVDGEILNTEIPADSDSQEKPAVAVPTSVMTLRADKQDIDAFAAEKIDFDKFAGKVSVITY